MLINTGLTIHRQALIELPAEIGRRMLAILDAMPNQGLEYGAYLQGRWDPITASVFVDPDKFYFPKQQVSPGSIAFHEEPPGPEWNVVIHRHPNGVRNFSSTDENSINEEFLASILFIPPWDFPAAVINIPLQDGAKFQVRAKVILDGGPIELDPKLREAVSKNVELYKMPSLEQMGRQQAAEHRAVVSKTASEKIGDTQHLGRGSVTVVDVGASGKRTSGVRRLRRSSEPEVIEGGLAPPLWKGAAVALDDHASRLSEADREDLFDNTYGQSSMFPRA